jgi:hypothetical protein
MSERSADMEALVFILTTLRLERSHIRVTCGEDSLRVLFYRTELRAAIRAATERCRVNSVPTPHRTEKAPLRTAR